MSALSRLLPALVLLAGCPDEVGPPSTACPGSGVAQLNDDDAGGSVSVFAGTDLSITLRDLAGDGGYVWWVVDQSGLGGGDYTEGEDPEPDVDGGEYPPYIYHFTTDGLATGSYNLELGYGQYPDDPPEMTWSVVVEVTGCGATASRRW